ncbi:MAG: DUF2871 domain-containing protein [Clostridia bacterium]
MKKLINVSFIYALAAIVSGVFYREFTKFLSFTGKTTLAFTHLHFLVMGFILFLILALFASRSNLLEVKQFKWFFTLYNVALPFMVVMLYVRGILQVLGTELSNGASFAISGISGIAHILMTISLVLLFIALKKQTIDGEKAIK